MTTDEIYRGYGVVHTDDCEVCDLTESIPRRMFMVRGKWINRVLIGTLLVSLGFLAGVYVAWQPSDPLERVYKAYNNVRIYEDGSWEGNDRNGLHVTGCIVGALCRD